MGKTLLMGRKTFQSIGKALPGRKTIVLTGQEVLQHDDVRFAKSIAEALEISREDDLFIAGGADIYRQTVALANELFLTSIDKEFDGDTRFPELDMDSWTLVSEKEYPATAKTPFSYKFLNYKRKISQGA